MANIQLNNLRVMVVEDMALIAEELERLLTRLGCEIIGSFSSASRALEAAQSRHTAIALLNVHLNGSDTYALADELLMLGIPFIFMTGYSKESLQSEFRGFPCLVKPFGAAELIAKLQEVLGREMASRP